MTYRVGAAPAKPPGVRAQVHVRRTGADVALVAWSAPLLLLVGALWVGNLPTVTCRRGPAEAVQCSLTGRGLLRPDLPVASIEAPALPADDEAPRLIVHHPGSAPSRIATDSARAAQVSAFVQGFAASGAREGAVRASYHGVASGAFLVMLAVALVAMLLRIPRGCWVRHLDDGDVEVEVERFVGRGARARFAAATTQSVGVEDIDDSALQKLIVVRGGVPSELCRGVAAEVAQAEKLLRAAMREG